MIGLIAVTMAGRASAARLAEAWPGETRRYDGPARQALHRAWAECDGLVCFLAVGATTRLVAPLLDSKWIDPAVVCVDEPGRYAVTLVGGHAAGANALCTRVADVFGAQAIITTATDATGLPGLDTLGWPAEGAIARVSRALLDGEPVGFESDATWPLPSLPVTIGAPGQYRIVVTDRIVPIDDMTVVLRPPSLIAGVGASKGVTEEEVLGLLDEALAVGGLARDSVTTLATVDAKAGEEGIVAAARQGGWPLRSYPASRLAAVSVPNPSEAALAAVGTPSVAEAAALIHGDELVVAKRKSELATVALARVRPRAGWRWSGSARATGISSPRGPSRNCGAPRSWWAWTSTWTRSATCCGPAPGCCPAASVTRSSGPPAPWPKPARGTRSRWSDPVTWVSTRWPAPPWLSRAPIST